MTPLDQLKLPLRVRRVIAACREGRTLMLTMVNLQGGGQERVYTYHRKNPKDPRRLVGSPYDYGRVPTTSAEEAIASGELVPNDDGLFAETTQTWRARL